MTDGFGTITFWGFTPALDIQDVHHDFCTQLQKRGVRHDDSDTLNILLVGAGDLRHVLKTVAQSWRHKKRKLNFYIVENSLELYARDMLLLAIALEPQNRLGLQEKTELYLELFANLLIRQQTVDYIKYMANEMIRMITDSDYLEQKLRCLDLSRLKYKEIDMLEGIAKFWKSADRTVFDVHNHWDMRLRQYLGVRYDAIPNVFDWDYSMKLCDRGGEIINGRVYNTWRRTGVAYELRDGTYDQPNYTLASGMVFKKEGERIARRGYWGDILVSPYVTHGIESENETFFKKKNEVLVSTAIDVAQYNITALFHELVNQSEYKPRPQDEDTPSESTKATLSEITEEDEDENGSAKDSHTEEKSENADPLKTPYSSMPLEDVRITLLPLNCTDDLHEKERYQKLFNVVYFSNSMVHKLNSNLSGTFADKAHIILESAKFMLELKPEQLTEFGKKVVSIAAASGCRIIREEYDGAKDCFINMVYQPV